MVSLVQSYRGRCSSWVENTNTWGKKNICSAVSLVNLDVIFTLRIDFTAG